MLCPEEKNKYMDRINEVIKGKYERKERKGKQGKGKLANRGT